MKVSIAVALAALAAPSPLIAQTTSVDPSYAVPLPGGWSYAAAPDGSEAIYRDASARPQLVLHCTRATRQVRISKPATGAAPFMIIWTSSMTRSVPASFDP